MKHKRNYSFLTSRSIAKTSYTIRSSGVLLQTGRVFLMTFIVGVNPIWKFLTKLPIVLQETIKKFLPALLDGSLSDAELQLFALPTRLAGLGVLDTVQKT